MKSKMAIVVMSSDGFVDVASIFFQIFNDKWSDCPFNIYYVTEDQNPSFRGVKTLSLGSDKSWSERLLDTLSVIDEDKVMFLLEDYFFVDDIDTTKIENLLQLMNDKDLDYLRLVNIPRPTVISDENNQVGLITYNQPYGINLQAAIFSKYYLTKLLEGTTMNPWELEVSLLKKVDDRNKNVISWAGVDLSGTVKIENAVLKGKWFPAVIDLYEGEGYNFACSNREILSKKEVISFQIKRNLKRYLTNRQRRFLKKILSKIGFKFTTKY